jgi:hypothetical protein
MKKEKKKSILQYCEINGTRYLMTGGDHEPGPAILTACT